MTDIFAALQATTVSAEGWETAKGVMMTISTAATMWIVRTLFHLRDAVRDLKSTVIGADGRNGLNSKIRKAEARLDAIEDRNIALDTIAELEKAEYRGPERRKRPRRHRDKLLPEIPPVDEDK